MRRALPLALLFVLLQAAPASARLIAQTGPIHGETLATALSGEDVVVARRPERGPVRVELYRPGSPPRLLLRATPPVPAKDDDANDDAGAESVSLAASSQAVAVSVLFGREDVASSRTYVGTPGAPLREVDACARDLLARPVAVDGAVVARPEGGCVTPGSRLGVGRAAIVTGSVEPGAEVSRVAVPANTLVGGLALRGGRRVVSLLSPRFFGFASELRTFGPEGIGEPFQTEEFGFLDPTGILDDGTLTLVRSSEDEGDEDSEDTRRCDPAAEAIAPGTNRRARINVGGCLRDPDERFASNQGAGGRLVSLVDPPAKVREQYDGTTNQQVQAAAVTSVRPGKRGVERIVTGGYRPPLTAATDGSRIAFASPRCDGDQEVTVVDAPVGGLDACVLRVRTHRARIRGGRIRLRIDCPRGCVSKVFDETSCGFGRIAGFTLAPGSHRVRLRVPPGARRAGRLIVRIDTASGPSRRVEIKLTR